MGKNVDWKQSGLDKENIYISVDKVGIICLLAALFDYRAKYTQKKASIFAFQVNEGRYTKTRAALSSKPAVGIMTHFLITCARRKWIHFRHAKYTTRKQPFQGCYLAHEQVGEISPRQDQKSFLPSLNAGHPQSWPPSGLVCLWALVRLATIRGGLATSSSEEGYGYS